MKNAVRIPIEKVPSAVLAVLDGLTASGFAAHLVGGCVRDLLRGETPSDFDVTTNAEPQKIKEVFSGFRTVDTGIRHGTVTVLPDGFPVEVTTWRQDGAYTDGRHPDAVRFVASLEEDLARRDFTVNAMAADRYGNVTDPFGGMKDLETKTLRCVGDPERRFREDALRILRAVRFSSTLGFTVEDTTKKAAFALAGRLRLVSAERIAAELSRLLCGSNAEETLRSFLPVLGVPVPELLPMAGFDQKNRHHIYDVYEHTVRVVGGVPPKLSVRLAALFHDAGKPAVFTQDETGEGHFYGHAQKSEEIADAVLHRLHFDHDTARRVTTLIRRHDVVPEVSERAVSRLLGKLGEELFFDLLDLRRADNEAQSEEYRERGAECRELARIARELLARGACFSLADLAIDGSDLLAAGCSQGKTVGRVLHALLSAVTDGTLPNDREALLGAALEWKKRKTPDAEIYD